MDNESLGRLIKTLRRGSHFDRRMAAEKLGQLRATNAVDALVSAVDDPQEDVRRAAVEALECIGDTGAIELLIGALTYWNPDVRQSILEILNRIDPQWRTSEAARAQIPAFIGVLSSLDVDVCRAAVEALDKIHPYWASSEAVRAKVPDFIAGLENSAHRCAAAELLGHIRDVRAVEALTNALSDGAWDVLSAAAEALARIGDAHAIEALVHALRDQNTHVRQAASEALVRMGGAYAIEALVRTLGDRRSLVRQAAAEKLKRIDPLWPTSKVARAQAVELIEDLEDEDETVRQAASKVLDYWSWDGGDETSRTCTVGVLGECSVGKSTLVHLLLGGRFRQDHGRLPRTTVPILFRYGHHEMVRLTRSGGIASIVPIEMMERHFQVRDSDVVAGGIEIFLPIESLKEREMLDTQGFNSGRKDMDVYQTRAAIQQCQVLIWCTRPPRAWQGSESAEWKRILQSSPKLRRRSMLLINWDSQAVDPEKQESVRQRIQRQTKDLFARIEIADLNEAREARPADRIVDEELWRESGFACVEKAIQELIGRSQQPAKRAVQTVTLPGGVRMELVWIRGGTFQMGALPEDDDADDSEKPVHQIRVDGFWMGRFPVTQRQWQSVMGTNPSHFQGDDLPVENVSWHGVKEFLKKAGRGLRLPTEAEWEYAARGGATSPRYGELDEIAWYSSNSGARTHPVGKKQANTYGLHDMLGNVWEWCEDAYRKVVYRRRQGVTINPLVKGNSDSLRMARGGSWYTGARDACAWRRWTFFPSRELFDLGFRVCGLPDSYLSAAERNPEGSGGDG